MKNPSNDRPDQRSHNELRQGGAPSEGSVRKGTPLGVSPVDARQVDQSLARSFRPPDGLGARARGWTEASPAELIAKPRLSSTGATASTGAARSGRAGGAGGGGPAGAHSAPLGVLAAAAVLLLIIVPRFLGSRDPVELTASDAAALLAHRAGVPLDAGLAGGLPDPAALRASLGFLDGVCPDAKDGIAAPDLASLYHEVVASAGSQESHPRSCPSRLAGDSLLATLRERYGAGLREGHDAERMAGPFPSDEWRGGTVLAAFPEEGGLPSVLVAEDAQLLSCCIDLEEPRDPSLRVFTWPVGDVVLLEITQASEPRFLDRFELQ